MLCNRPVAKKREIARIMEKRIQDVNITFGRYVETHEKRKEQGEEQFRLRNPVSRL
jgi:hypothetical protein